MKRTTTRRRREISHFIEDNRRLFPFVGLFLLGVLGGILLYITAADRLSVGLDSLLQVRGITAGWQEGLQALANTCFSGFLLLSVLFLLGVWPCGVPFVLLVPLFYGLSVGLTEAYYYAQGGSGVMAVVAVVLPTAICNAALLIAAGVESMRLSVRIARRLLPSDRTADDLSQPFRLYCLRFLLFAVGVAAVGILHVLLRTVFAALLV